MEKFAVPFDLMEIETVDHPVPIETIDQPEPERPTWCEKKLTAVHEEIKRMSQLPANCTYVAHRLKVLNKILQLVSIQEDELESLFAGLSL